MRDARFPLTQRFMAYILVISPDWRTRALLAAQLCETCNCDTVSAPGVDEALILLSIAPAQLVLVIVDTGQAQGEIGPAEIERLLSRLPGIPVILITSAFQQATLAQLGTHLAAYLTRPVSIGKVAETAKGILEEKGT